MADYVSVHEAVGTAYSTFPNADKRLVVDSTGRLWTAYRVHGTYIHVYVAYSDDRGSTWTVENILDVERNQGDTFIPEHQGVVLAVDSQDSIHVVWIGYGETSSHLDIYYRDRDAEGVWGSLVNVSGGLAVGGSSTQAFPSVAVDSSNNVHVAWALRGHSGQVDSSRECVGYRRKADQGWETIDIVYESGDSSSRNICLAVDGFDYPHIVWNEELGVGLFYVKKTALGWGSVEAIMPGTDLYMKYWPSLRLDSGDVPHVVYYGYPDESDVYYKIFYNFRAEGGWLAENIFIVSESVSGHQYNPSLCIDEYDDLHVLWYGFGWEDYPEVATLVYRAREDGYWGDMEIFLGDIDEAHRFPTPLMNGGLLHLTFTAGTATAAFYLYVPIAAPILSLEQINSIVEVSWTYPEE